MNSNFLTSRRVRGGSSLLVRRTKTSTILELTEERRQKKLDERYGTTVNKREGTEGLKKGK